jgi:acyl-phosphate glycerol 3-phosphate acyltransferase
MKYAAVVVLAYLLGSIPFGFLAGLIAGVDVRKSGSGNIGATNVLRLLGKKYGYTVFVADVLKGFLAVRFGLWLGDDPTGSHLLGIVAALCVVLGHSFPIWLGLRGGKGVATSAGACIGLLPTPTLFAAVVWIAVFFCYRYVSLASIVAATVLPIVIWTMSLPGGDADYPMLALSVVVAVLVIWRHRSNILRLFKGTEPRFERK